MRQAIKVDTSVYDAYLGQYEVVRNLIVTVTREETKLLAQATGYSKVEFFPESEIEFFAKQLDAQIMFVGDDSGKITHARITLNELEMQARKLNDFKRLAEARLPSVHFAMLRPPYQSGPEVPSTAIPFRLINDKQKTIAFRLKSAAAV